MADQEALNREANRLYEQYGKPLEAEHWGEFVAITPNGRAVIASTPVEAFMKASKALGPGSYIFKVGERIAQHSARRSSAGRSRRTFVALDAIHGRCSRLPVTLIGI